MLTDPVNLVDTRPLPHKSVMSRSCRATLIYWGRLEAGDFLMGNMFDFAQSESLGIRLKTDSPKGKRYAY